MIKVNGKVVKIEKYPDGTPRINFGDEDFLYHSADGYFHGKDDHGVEICWKYENNEEVFYLMLIKRHLENNFGMVKDTRTTFDLIMPYVPNARMDRTKSNDEVFTLKFFCEFINSLNFDHVTILDAHSDVSVALLNKCENVSPRQYIKKSINNNLDLNNAVLYFPDAGAAKRYSGLFPTIPYCYGEKKRDWKTGKILGLEVKTNGLDLTEKDVLMIDDIIAYGGSLYYSALELKKYGVNKICAYATHTENSILDKEKGTLIKLLENGTVERLFTTDSLFTGNHEKITVMEVL